MIPCLMIFCDGSYDLPTRTGGWAAIVKANNARRHLANWEPETTISRMELLAAVEGLKVIQRFANVTLYSDSEYVINGMNDPIRVQTRLTRRADQNPMKNDDLWQQLEHLASKHAVTWVHIRGHQAVTDKVTKFHALADKLAGQARTLQRPLNELHVRDK